MYLSPFCTIPSCGYAQAVQLYSASAWSANIMGGCRFNSVVVGDLSSGVPSRGLDVSSDMCRETTNIFRAPELMAANRRPPTWAVTSRVTG
jgi:hypothetical protein